MLALDVRQHDGGGDTVEHIGRRCPAATLLDQCVPSRADIGPLGHLLAAQAGSAAGRAGSSFCRVPKANMKTTCLTPLHGRVDGGDVLWPALSKFRIDGCNNKWTIETLIGLRKDFGSVVVPQSSQSLCADGFGRARDSHDLVPEGTLQQFPNDGSARMAAGPLRPIFMSTCNTSPTNKLLVPLLRLVPAVPE